MHDLETVGNYDSYTCTGLPDFIDRSRSTTEHQPPTRAREVSCTTNTRTAGKLAQLNTANIITVSDIHGIPTRLLLALEQSGCIKMNDDRSAWTVQERFLDPESRIVILGDMLGWDTVGVLEILTELQRQEAHPVMIAGNWETAAIAAANGNQDKQREYGASASGAQVLRSLAGIQESEGYRNPFDALRFVLRDRYASLLGENALQIAFEQDGKLATHAGMDDVWTEKLATTGVKGMNALFQNLRVDQQIDQIADQKNGKLSGIVWMSPKDTRNNTLMTEERAEKLKENNIEILLRGHDHQGLHISTMHGIEIVNIAAETPTAYQGIPAKEEIQWAAAMTRKNVRGIDLWRNHV